MGRDFARVNGLGIGQPEIEIRGCNLTIQVAVGRQVSGQNRLRVSEPRVEVSGCDLPVAANVAGNQSVFRPNTTGQDFHR